VDRVRGDVKPDRASMAPHFRPYAIALPHKAPQGGRWSPRRRHNIAAKQNQMGSVDFSAACTHHAHRDCINRPRCLDGATWPLLSAGRTPIQRGNNRGAIFFAAEDYARDRDWRAEAATDYGCAVHGAMLMTNHVHLLRVAARAAFLRDWPERHHASAAHTRIRDM
jgi:hypothetical protein